MRISPTTITKLRTLVLMNWRGIFFEPFEMDPTVTALEGENGAGKSTTMIASHIAMVPDLSLLQFHTDAEVLGTKPDRGIYGRLGGGGPSYAILDFDVGGKRIMAGVQLYQGAYPKLSLVQFVITGVPYDHALEQLLLLHGEGTDTVPDLQELREQVALAGGKLTDYPSVKEYGKALFDFGIMPVDLETHGARQKFNRMLKTSMEGGLSRDIQRGLRDYLLAEDTGLRSRVKDMKENLDQCRITRQKIQETLTRKTNIEEILNAGFTMFEAGFHAARLHAEDQRAKVRSAQERHAGAVADHGAEAGNIVLLVERQQKLAESLEQVGKDRDAARELSEKRERARGLRRQIEAIEPQREDAFNALQKAKATREKATTAHEEAEREKEKSYGELTEIAEQKGNSEKAWEEVSRKVGEYNQAVRNLRDAKAALPAHEVSESTVESVLAECNRQWNEALSKKGQAEIELEQAETNRQRYETVRGALSAVAGRKVSETEAETEAKRIDREFRDKALAIEDAGTLAEKIELADRQAARQQSIRGKVADLASEGFQLSTGEAVRQAHQVVQGRLAVAREEQARLTQEVAQAEVRRAPVQEEAKQLERDAEGWAGAKSMLRDLEGDVDVPLRSQADVKSLEQRLAREQQAVAGRKVQADTGLARVRESIRELQARGGRIEDSLLSLKDRLDCPLVADRFDEVSQEEAAEIEARLGPLHAAILVDDPQRAAATIARIEERPDTVWLVEADKLRTAPEGMFIGNSVLVSAGDAWRVTRKPERPVVGQAAREAEIQRLRHEEESFEASIESMEDRISRTERARERIAELYRRGWKWVGAEDPGPQWEERKREVKDLLKREADVRRAATDSESHTKSLASLFRTIGECLSDADLLDAENWAETATTLRQKQSDAIVYKRELQTHRENLEVIRGGMLQLQNPPVAREEIEGLRGEVERCQETLSYWGKGRDLLQRAIETLPSLAYADQCALAAKNESALAFLSKRYAEVTQRHEGWKTLSLVRAKTLQESREAEDEVNLNFRSLEDKLATRRTELSELGEDGLEESLVLAAQLFRSLERRYKELEASEREAAIGLAQGRERLNALSDAVTATKDSLKEAVERFSPIWSEWRSLRREAQDLGVLSRALERVLTERYDAMGTSAALGKADKAHGELKVLLRRAEQSEETLSDVESILSEEPDASLRGGAYLKAWIVVRRYLGRSIPRDLVETDDPRRALEAMEVRLKSLQTKLKSQEFHLRTRSNDVATHIANQIRRERNRIGVLNEKLQNVRFGSIRGVRIHITNIDTMKNILEVLRTQPDLFASMTEEMTLEDALAQIYKRESGGDVKGNELLDYRRYVQLNIMVRRLTGDDWELAGSGLSNGESIGVGAAVLMVIQEAWEHQATMLRGRSHRHRSLRFLFLDEAARLSQKSLITLAEFCDDMQMQLLVAAPAADQAYRGRVFTLVREVNNGQEEVVVRGRRIRDSGPTEGIH